MRITSSSIRTDASLPLLSLCRINPNRKGQGRSQHLPDRGRFLNFSIWRRAPAVMAGQARALGRLRLLILGLTAFLLVFSVSGFVLLDVYLLSSVSETRLHFLDRTLSYFQSSVRACMTLRGMHLARNLSNPAVAHGVAADRASVASLADSMHDMHTLNYVSPPSQRVADFFLQQGLPMRVSVPGEDIYEETTTDFWDLVNQFISALLTASAIPLADLIGPDFSVNHLSQDKRAVVFVCVPTPRCDTSGFCAFRDARWTQPLVLLLSPVTRCGAGSTTSGLFGAP